MIVYNLQKNPAQLGKDGEIAKQLISIIPGALDAVFGSDSPDTVYNVTSYTTNTQPVDKSQYKKEADNTLLYVAIGAAAVLGVTVILVTSNNNKRR